MEKETQKEFDNLGRMIKRGFDGVDKRFDGVDKRFDGVDKRFDGVESRLDNLEDGHKTIELRLDNLAPKFEVDDLKKRVEKLEFAQEL